MAEPGKEDPYKGRFGIIRRIDDWIFTVEMAILWTFLGVSAVMVFLDVMYRRLAAPDSKVAELTARIFGIESPEAMETLTTVGPIVTGIIGVGLVYFAFWTAEAAFNLRKYDYFKVINTDGEISTADQPGTWHRDRMAHGRAGPQGDHRDSGCDGGERAGALGHGFPGASDAGAVGGGV